MPRRVKTPPRRIPQERSSTRSEKAGPSQEPRPGPSREPQGQRQSRRRSMSEPRRSRSSSSSSADDPSFRSPRMNRSRSEQRNAPRRTRVGTRALKEITRLQLTTELLIPKLPFARVIREVLMEYSHQNLRITPEALLCLQESAEIYLVQLFEDSYRCTLHRDRVTLMPKDMNLSLYLRERWVR